MCMCIQFCCCVYSLLMVVYTQLHSRLQAAVVSISNVVKQDDVTKFNVQLVLKRQAWGLSQV